ncbi:hypothetical protein [Methylobacterium sp. CM6247]
MKNSTNFIAALKHEHARLGHLLEVIDNGLWWTTGEPGRVKVEDLQEQAETIKAAIGKIERVVSQIGS